MPQQMFQLFRVIGTLEIPGNSSNPGVGQSINYSFDLDYSHASGDVPTIVGKPVVISFGPLGDFELVNVSHAEGQGFAGFFSSIAEIDLMFTHLLDPPPPTLDEGVAYSWLWSCNNNATGPCAPFHREDGPSVLGKALARVYEWETPDLPVPYTPQNLPRPR